VAARELDSLMEDANRAMLALLDDFRKSVLLALIQAQEPFSATYRQLLREVDALLAQTQAQMTRTMAEHLEVAANAGDDAALDEVRSFIGSVNSYVGVSEVLVRTSAEYVADLITAITNEARATITREVRLAALGGMTTTELIDRIGKTLDSPGVFKTLAARAEAIARTEVARIRNTAHFEQAKELSDKYEGVRKVWEHSGSSPGFSGHQRRQSRPNHIRTWQRTSEEPIPVADDFNLGSGITARYPHDPLLPASETVHCRCRVRLVAPEPKG